MSLQSKPEYRFYPTLLDAYQNLVDSDAIYDRYYGGMGEPPLSMEEFHEQKHKELLDKINRVEHVANEAVAKGTCLNEIVDGIVTGRKPAGKVSVKTVRDADDYLQAIAPIHPDADPDILRTEAEGFIRKIGRPFILATCEGQAFHFDAAFCREAARYFRGSLCQYFTAACLPTAKGTVELYGYVDYIRQNRVYDLKTTKSYAFGNYEKGFQRHAYTYCLQQSGAVKDILGFEYTVYSLRGGSARTPLITGQQNREVYTSNPRLSRDLLTQACENLIEFVNDHIDEIDKQKTKIFNKAI